MGEWAIPLHRSKANKLHKRFCRLLIIMALVGGALIEIGDNSAPDECEEGGPMVSIGNLFFWTSILSVAINVSILYVSIFTRKMSAGEVYLQTFFHIIMLIIVVSIFGEAIYCHFPFVVAPSYNIGAGF